ncbi:hypothetical protein K435DRAFT_201525, partial [Dendrothele bispora CBS 962.96]
GEHIFILDTCNLQIVKNCQSKERKKTVEYVSRCQRRNLWRMIFQEFNQNENENSIPQT